MFCRCHFAQVKSLVLFQKGKWQRTLPTISRQVFLLPFTERGRASFQEDKWRNCHRHISWTGLNSPPNFCCFVSTIHQPFIQFTCFLPFLILYRTVLSSKQYFIEASPYNADKKIIEKICQLSWRGYPLDSTAKYSRKHQKWSGIWNKYNRI